MQNRLPGLALNLAFQTTRRFLEMQTQPVPDPCSPTARAHPSLPHIPSFTLTRTHTRVQTRTHRAARPRTPRHPWLSQVPPPWAPAGPPASGAPLAPPHARARMHSLSPRTGRRHAVGGGVRKRQARDLGVESPSPSRARLPPTAFLREGSGLPFGSPTRRVGAENI